MLQHSKVATRLPAQDLERARAFYAEKLGLEPIEERPGGLKYECGNGYFALFESTGAPSGEHTQMAWEVDDLDAVMAELHRRGVGFEDVDLPGLRTVDGIAEVVGNYPRPAASARERRGSVTAKEICLESVSRYAEDAIVVRGCNKTQIFADNLSKSGWS